MKKIMRILAGLALAFGASTMAQAGVSFDPDGAPGGAPVIDIGTLDWSPTSLLAKNSILAIADFGGISGGTCEGGGFDTQCGFDVYLHASLVGSTNQDGDPNTMTGLNTSYEITMIARFSEVVTSVTDSNGDGFFELVTFRTVAGPNAALVEIYYDSLTDLNGLTSNGLTGSGYNDGDLILRGTEVTDTTSLFLNTSLVPVTFDQSPNGDDYGSVGANQLSVSGTGSTGNIGLDQLTTDPAFFLTALDTFGVQFAAISLGLPFIGSNPSDCFTGAGSGIVVVGNTLAGTSQCDTAHTDAAMSAQTDPDGAGPGILPVIGTINGGVNLPLGSAPDFMAATDYNSPVTAAIPEPGSLALLGLGLGALGLGFRRRGLGLRLS